MPEPILIVDDHSIVRRGYRSLLAGTPDLEIVGEASTGDETLRGWTQSRIWIFSPTSSLPV
jgi:DNA-binding NarL/FixJ family response regulator